MLALSLGDERIIDADAVVGDRHLEIGVVLDADVDVFGMRMLADIGERLLNDEDHLKLLARRKLRATPRDSKTRVHAGLSLEAINHGPYALDEAFLVQTLAEVEKEFAHVLVALLNARANGGKGFVTQRNVVSTDGVRQELHLQIEEGERLSDRVVQALCKELTFLHHGELAVALDEAVARHGDAEVGHEVLEQADDLRRELRAFLEEEREDAEVARRRTDLEAVGRLETRVGKASGKLVLKLGELEADGIGLREHRGHDARVARQIVDRLDEVDGKSLGREELHRVVTAREQLERTRIGLGLAHDSRDEAVGKVVKAATLREIGGHLVELREMAVLFFDAGRLLGHLLLEIVVRILESGGHLVEACGDLADFVLAPHFGAGRQVARR